MTKKALALCTADIHLTTKSPKIWDKNVWLEAQAKMLKNINTIALDYGVPVVAAGDIFDKSTVPPKIEMMAMNYMSDWNLLFGQHDLPQHNPSKIPESSYGVLKTFNTPYEPQLDLYEFGWGTEFIPLNEQEKERKHKLTCAVVHAMVWYGDPPYPGAPSKGNVDNLTNLLAGYDFIVAGDNHKSFVMEKNGTVVVNCGSTMRRTVAQMDYKPKVHVLFDDKSVESVELDISGDVVSAEHKEDRVEKMDRIDAFVETLKDDVEIDLSFHHNLERYMEANNVDSEVKTLILETLHDAS